MCFSIWCQIVECIKKELLDYMRLSGDVTSRSSFFWCFSVSVGYLTVMDRPSIYIHYVWVSSRQNKKYMFSSHRLFSVFQYTLIVKSLFVNIPLKPGVVHYCVQNKCNLKTEFKILQCLIVAITNIIDQLEVLTIRKKIFQNLKKLKGKCQKAINRFGWVHFAQPISFYSNSRFTIEQSMSLIIYRRLF